MVIKSERGTSHVYRAVWTSFRASFVASVYVIPSRCFNERRGAADKSIFRHDLDKASTMSSLARSAMQARISKLPNLPPEHPMGENEEEEEGDSIGALPSASMPPPRYGIYFSSGMNILM
jgi:hypothetical protein